MSVTNAIILDKRREKSAGLYPVKLQIIVQGAPFRYQTVYSLTLKDYEKLSCPNIGSNLRKVREDLKLVTRAVETYIQNSTSFCIVRFERDFIKGNRLFLQRKRKNKAKSNLIETTSILDLNQFTSRFPILKEDQPSPDAISTIFVVYITKLLQEDRIGSAINYQDTYHSLKKFRGNVNLSEITPSYLIQYEKWMYNSGRSKSTVGIKLRPLRAIFNFAIDGLGLIKRDSYPFGRYKYLIPTSKNTKKSLEMDTIGRMFYYQPQTDEERRARDFWFFLYFGNGMNPKDMAFLKYKNIHGEYLVFDRAKTINTARANPKPITAYITEEMSEIINTWGNEDSSLNNYIFPILADKMTSLEQYYAIKAFNRNINYWNKKICKELGIENKIGAMQARHSFATRLKHAGASTEFIQETLGHADKKTTENYLNSFENELKKKYASQLAPFKLRSEYSA